MDLILLAQPSQPTPPLSNDEKEKKGSKGGPKKKRYYYDVKDQKKRKEILFQKLYRNAKWRAQRKNREFTIDMDFIRELYKKQRGLCALTGKRMTYETEQSTRYSKLRNMSLDRICSEIGYIPNNCRLVWSVVNRLKNDLKDRELFDICYFIAKKFRNINPQPQLDNPALNPFA